MLFCCLAADVYCKLLKVVCILQNSYFYYSETVFVSLSLFTVRRFQQGEGTGSGLLWSLRMLVDSSSCVAVKVTSLTVLVPNQAVRDPTNL